MHGKLEWETHLNTNSWN